MSEIIDKPVEELETDDTANLNLDQINNILQEPDEPPKNPKPQDTSKAIPQTDPSQTEPPANEPTETDDGANLLAGKYKSIDDLRKATVEITNKIYGESPLTKLALKQVETMDKPEELTDFYKALESELGKKTAQEPPSPEPDSQVPLEDTGNMNAVINQAAIQEVRLQLSQSPEIVEIQRMGYELPQSTEDWNQLLTGLRQVDPVLYLELRQRIQSIVTQVNQDIESIKKSFFEADSFNEKQITKDRQKILAFSKEMGFDLTEDELNQFIDKAKANTKLYHDNFGTQYLSDEAIYNEWYVKESSKYLKKLKEIASAQGRLQGIEDIEKAKHKIVNSLGNNHAPARSTQHRSDKAKIDPNDWEQVSQMNLEEINKMLDGV